MSTLPQKPPKRSQWLLALIVIAAIIGALLWWRSGAAPDATGESGPGGFGKGAGKPTRTPVALAIAKTGDIGVSLSGLGTVTPLNTVTVKSRVDGQLMKVLFSEGQMVKAGDVLAEIDPRQFQADLAQTEGQLARDQALLKNAQLDLERYRTLFAQDSIAKQQLDTQAALVQQYQGTVKADQGLVANTRLQLSYTQITAPISGRLGLRQVDTGNMLRAADTTGLVVITQLQPITVVFTIPQDDVPTVLQRWQGGEKLPVDAYDREQKIKLASGELLTLDNQIDTTTGTVKLKAQFANLDSSLFPNQFVNVRMLVDTRRGVTLIPAAALQRGTQGATVYVLKGSSVELRQVKTGAADGDQIAIESGIVPGESVVVDGIDRLRDGAEVEVVTRDGKTDSKNPGAAATGQRASQAGKKRAGAGAANKGE